MTTTDTTSAAENGVGEELTLEALGRCYEGAVPAVVCTADAEGTPNITYISRVHLVDHERLALSNQFMSKTSRNLAVNPVASVLLIDPLTYDEYHLMLVYERTERRGPVFERLRDDVAELAEQMGLRDVFRLRAADIFRVRSIERVGLHHPLAAATDPPSRDLATLAEFAAMVDRAGDLDGLLDVALDGLDRVLGYRHICLLLLDETGTHAFTIASRGFDTENLGSEIALGEGPIGSALAQCEVRRTTGLRALAKYSRTIQQSFEAGGQRGVRELPMPSLSDADVRIVAPLRSLGQLIGGLVVEHRVAGSLSTEDAHVVGAAATMIAGALEQARILAGPESDASERETISPSPSISPVGDAVAVRCFEVDGSVFIDGEYLIKGVAGRILRALVAEHVASGRTEFTNRELRLDRSLDLPGFKDNLESRLVLLKRRLEERQAPCRIERTGRGRFRLDVTTPLRLELVAEPSS
jgi:adenylate cyclase